MINVYLQDIVTLWISGGYDQYGEPLAETNATVAARWESKTRLVQDARGEQVVAMGRFLMTNRALSHEDMIEFNGIRHAIISVGCPRDFGWNYIEAWVK